KRLPARRSPKTPSPHRLEGDRDRPARSTVVHYETMYMRSGKAPHPRRSINARSSGSFFPILAKQTYRNDAPGVIVHVSQPIVVNEMVQIDTEPSDTR